MVNLKLRILIPKVQVFKILFVLTIQENDSTIFTTDLIKQIPNLYKYNQAIQSRF